MFTLKYYQEFLIKNKLEQLLQQETQASWLALPLWGGMGEAFLIFSYSRIRIVIEGS